MACIKLWIFIVVTFATSNPSTCQIPSMNLATLRALWKDFKMMHPEASISDLYKMNLQNLWEASIGNHSQQTIDNVVQSTNTLSVSLLPHLPPDNLVMSSFSLGTVLGMVLAGAQGSTRKQILQLFQNNSLTEVAFGSKEMNRLVNSYQDGGNITLKTANRIYVDQSFRILANYTNHLEWYHGAKAVSVSFIKQPKMSRQEINKWVSVKTNEKIKDLLSRESIGTDTRLVLVNAIYFKGDWAHKFNPKNTFMQQFYVQHNETVNVPMMNQNGKFGLKTITELGDATALRMPYKGEKLDMIFILPNNGESLYSMEEKMKTVDMTKALADIHPMTRRFNGNVDVSIPKFKIESTLELNDPLMKIGVTDMFDCSADLSGISRRREFSVSLVVQKAFIEVSEEGTEAAAASGVGFHLKCLGCGPPIFVLNRPFYYTIRDRASGLELFSGRVVNPSTTSQAPRTK